MGVENCISCILLLVQSRSVQNVMKNKEVPLLENNNAAAEFAC